MARAAKKSAGKSTEKSAKVVTKGAAKKSPPGLRAHVLYHKDGSVWARGRMSGDMMAGYWEWYRTDGTIMRSGSFEHGEPAGEWTTYDSKGHVVKVTNKSKRPRAMDAARPALARSAPARRNSPQARSSKSKARPSTPKARSRTSIHKDILAYNAAQSGPDQRICDALARTINQNLPDAENKIWHRHPVWFLAGNPIVGYSKLKDGIRLLFWSGKSFNEPGLSPEGGFMAAEARFTAEDQISATDLERWLAKSIKIQWDYKNIVKRKGRLERLK